MDCTDMIISFLSNELSQIRDYYSLTLATPFIDDYIGGHDSLTSATAYHDNNDITTIIFRKPLNGLFFFFLFFHLK